MRRYRNYKRRATRGKRVGRKTGKRLTKPIKQYIKKTVANQGELKQAFKQNVNNDIITLANTTPTAISLLPEPSQGTGDSDRIGAYINMRKVIVRGFVNLKAYNSGDTTPVSPGPFLVRAWVLSAKNIQTNVFSNTLAATSFFEFNNTSQAPTSNMNNMLYTVNKKLFTVHKTKSWKLGAASTSSVNNPSFYYDNSPMSAPFYFDCSKFVHKLKFDEGQTWATNANLFLVWMVCRADGAASNTVAPIEYHYTLQTAYTDA